jgi:hypothetical protein
MRMNVILCLALIVMSGCTGAPGVSGIAYGDKEACVNLANGKVHLVIVTDGKMGPFGVRAAPLIPPHFEGTLGSDAISLSYSAQGRHISIGDNKYDLSQGCLFGVSLANKTPVIRQMSMSQREMVQTFLENNAELKEFFPENSKKTLERTRE